MHLSENLSQDLAQWYRQQQVENSGLDAPELWATDLSAQQRAVRNEMIGRWMSESQESIRAEIADSLHAPDLVTVHRPTVDGADDVRAGYRPQGAGGSRGDPGACRRRARQSGPVGARGDGFGRAGCGGGDRATGRARGRTGTGDQGAWIPSERCEGRLIWRTAASSNEW